MAVGVVRVSDVVVPEVFDPMVSLITTEKTAILNSGAVVEDAALSAKIAGEGLTYKMPAYDDLDNDAANVMTTHADDVYPSPIGSGTPYQDSNNSVPNKIATLTEIVTGLRRHQSWSSQKLAALLSGSDPMAAIAARVGAYWARERQRTFLAMMAGIFADNDAAPSGGDTHIQGDLTYDASGSSYTQGVTDFTTQNFLRATLTMGDMQDDLGLVLMHPVVYHRAKVSQLIDYQSDAVNPNAASIPTFLGHRVVVDNGMPNDGSVFDTWICKAGAVRFGAAPHPEATEFERHARAGNGAGQDVLHSRVIWAFHLSGVSYIGTPAEGGPSNAATSNNLAAAGSWSRVYPERNMIGIARLKTREVA